MYEYHGSILRVIDGDTYEVDVDLGFRVHYRATVRLRTVDTAERYTQKGREATAALKELIEGEPCYLKTYKGDENDKYGRWIADVSVSTLTGGVIDLASYVTQMGWLK